MFKLFVYFRTREAREKIVFFSFNVRTWRITVNVLVLKANRDCLPCRWNCNWRSRGWIPRESQRTERFASRCPRDATFSNWNVSLQTISRIKRHILVRFRFEESEICKFRHSCFPSCQLRVWTKRRDDENRVTNARMQSVALWQSEIQPRQKKKKKKRRKKEKLKRE